MDQTFSNPDRVLRATGDAVEIRFVLVDATAAVNHIADAHAAAGFARQLLGESVAASLLLASGLKGPGTAQLRFSFSGDISRVSADATPLGLVRAMIPQEELQRVGRFEPMLLPGTLTVRKLDRNSRVLSEGVVEMPSAEISPALTHYLRQSEQGKSLARVAALSDESGDQLLFCGGFLLEGFPGLREGHWIPFAHIAQSVDLADFLHPEGAGLDLFRLFETLTAPFPSHVHQEFAVEPFCPCSEDGVLRALTGLGRDEVESLYLEGGDLELYCEFCRQRYVVRVEKLKGLLEEMGEAESDKGEDGTDEAV